MKNQYFGRAQAIITVFLISVVSLSVNAQKKQILLLGTAHNFKSNMNQDFQTVVDKIIEYHPTIFCIEAIPPSDSISLKNVQSKALKKVTELTATLHLTEQKIKDSLSYYKKESQKRQVSASTLSRLALFYFITKEIGGNADYFWYQTSQTPHVNTDSLALGFLNSKKYNEHFNVIFPAAQRLGITYLYPVDERSGYPLDIKAQQETQLLLTRTENGKQVVANYLNAQSLYSSKEKEGKLFELLNDSSYQNLISDVIIKTYPNVTNAESAKQMKDLWEQRNMEIAMRIKSAIMSSKKRDKVLVSFGAAHIPLLKLYLKKLMPEYSVYNFQEYFTNR